MGEVDDLAIDAHLPAVPAVDTSDDLHQRGLSGSVLPDEAVDRAGAHLERDIVQHFDSEELFADPRGAQHRCIGHGASTSTHVRSAADLSTASVTNAARTPSAKVGTPSRSSPAKTA